MRYVSTRGAAPTLSFEEAMLSGLARDGGLYVPETWPRMAPDAIAALAGLPYEEVARRVMTPFLGDAFTADEFAAIVNRAYAGFGHAARAPLAQVDANDWVLELHHGPTLAFKDFAMQLIGQMFELSLGRSGGRVTIVGATSGDTGSAAIEAFRGLDAADVFILYPHGRVSEVQRRQMTTPQEANVHAIAVEGDFDACQALVKAMFNDLDFRDRMKLAAVNSINWARILAQVVYYFSSAVALGAPSRSIMYTVPTGNFGDVFAGHVARAMGLPIERLVIATNANDILHRTLETGRHDRAGVQATTSPSMDIEVSSNFERLLFELYGCDGAATSQLMAELKGGGFVLRQGALAALREGFASGRADVAETAAEIARVRETTGMIVDPHTAVGLVAARTRRGDRATPMVTLGTAHAAKFPDAVEAACGVRPALPPRMCGLYDRAERVTVAPDNLMAVQTLIAERSRAAG
ncbi:threonine synthase [Rubrimonas cliftonensis]|uniref:Threonine synthase n=1 Tax=Rubrimonas cliftonensis TaxID=89524 RepID=A0A1H4EWE4_9RHOB|nr:threonine synthase [Rubrimonas cliftonensis]SEA89363.1 threonine synthase [Rubrimonas cliftonensis]